MKFCKIYLKEIKTICMWSPKRILSPTGYRDKRREKPQHDNGHFNRGTDKGDRRCLSVLCHYTCTIHTITQDLKLDFNLKIYIRSSTTHKQCIMRTHGGCVLYGWRMKLSIWGFIITVHAFDKRLVHNKTFYIFNKQIMSHVLHIFEREKRILQNLLQSWLHLKCSFDIM